MVGRYLGRWPAPLPEALYQARNVSKLSLFSSSKPWRVFAQKRGFGRWLVRSSHKDQSEDEDVKRRMLGVLSFGRQIV